MSYVVRYLNGAPEMQRRRNLRSPRRLFPFSLLLQGRELRLGVFVALSRCLAVPSFGLLEVLRDAITIRSAPKIWR
jgi:hypothetical protein